MTITSDAGVEAYSTLRLTVEYDGTEFSGFQWQPDARTVAGVLEAALGKLLCEDVKVTGAGRTDAGVHASGQVVSIATRSRFPFERLLHALNAVLPGDCSVREGAIVEPGFSARFSALERTYVYTILNRTQRDALVARYAWHVPGQLDLDAMRAAGACLVGEHDFRSFAASALRPGAPTSTVRTVRRLEIERRGELLRIEIAADGFLRHMVRTIVGMLAKCGLGRREPSAVAAVLAARDRSAAGPTAPARGLCLAGVRYPDGYDSFAPAPALVRLAALDGAGAFP
jgi:tRNA pseudouridine38-40 synthase